MDQAQSLLFTITYMFPAILVLPLDMQMGLLSSSTILSLIHAFTLSSLAASELKRAYYHGNGGC